MSSAIQAGFVRVHLLYDGFRPPPAGHASSHADAKSQTNGLEFALHCATLGLGLLRVPGGALNLS